jgi:hypothetical protein
MLLKYAFKSDEEKGMFHELHKKKKKKQNPYNSINLILGPP